MQTVRAVHKGTGEVISRFSATEVTNQTRRSLADLWNYTCLNDACPATFHWRQSYRADGNRHLIPATFAKNPSTKHQIGCKYDYSAFAEKHRDAVSIEDGRIHIRVNFPLGAAEKDVAPGTPNLRHYFNRISHRDASIKKTPIKSLRNLVDFIEKNLGSLEDVAMNDVDLDYQGRVVSWNKLFVASDDYKKLYDAAYDKKNREDSNPVLCVIKPTHSVSRNAKGRPRFACEAQYARPHDRYLMVQPILVCRDDEMGAHIEKIIRKNGSLLIAARPFPAVTTVNQNTPPVYLMALNNAQLAQVDTQTYWRLVSGTRHQTSFISKFGPDYK